jgi:hypothetical protein
VSRVAETIPELWLHRRGFFTIRGLKPLKGHGELDLVAYHPRKGEAVHVEVSASPDPRGFLGGEVAARIPQGIAKFVADKYHRANIARVREGICPQDTKWKLMLAHGKLNREEEVRAALCENKVEPVSLFTMLTELSGKLSYRVDTDAAYFAYLACAYADRTGGKKS